MCVVRTPQRCYHPRFILLAQSSMGSLDSLVMLPDFTLTVQSPMGSPDSEGAASIHLAWTKTVSWGCKLASLIVLPGSKEVSVRRGKFTTSSYESWLKPLVEQKTKSACRRTKEHHYMGTPGLQWRPQGTLISRLVKTTFAAGFLRENDPKLQLK